MNSLVSKIDDIIEQRSLLKHPFYEMWSDGKLSLDSLAGYSKEYYQLVKAVPSFMDKIISHADDIDTTELYANRQEEADHIKPWRKFTAALGISEKDLENYSGLTKTKQAVSELDSIMDSFEGGATAMYAFEKEIPKVSQTKLDGLHEFYGINDDDATNYFTLHTEADIRHAASWRLILEQSTNEEKLVKIAEKSVSAQNLLLDSCYEAYC